MVQALDELYPHIRHKLDVALQAWHPSDGSALVLLSPWQRVWGQAEWDAFMAKVGTRQSVWESALCSRRLRGRVQGNVSGVAKARRMWRAEYWRVVERNVRYEAGMKQMCVSARHC